MKVSFPVSLSFSRSTTSGCPGTDPDPAAPEAEDKAPEAPEAPESEAAGAWESEGLGSLTLTLSDWLTEQIKS